MFQFITATLAFAALACIVAGLLEGAVLFALFAVAWVILAHPSRPVPFSQPATRVSSAILRAEH